mgnify:CR=1 FL=1
MRNDEIYRPKPQSNQLEIFGLGMAGEQDVAEAEKAIKDAFRAAYGETFADHDGPVVMRISTTRPLAKSNPKYWEGRADLGKPDWDNLGKLACDALNGIDFKDDSQVDMGAVTKRPRSPYGTKPRIDIYIEYFVEEYVNEKK